MDIRIDRSAQIPIHEQLREQIVFLIATGKWAPGKILPSVRELERRYRIHRNTASHVYRELTEEGWLIRRTGRQMRVRSAEDASSVKDAKDLDGFINSIIHSCREHGYTLKQLYRSFSERIMEHPPDHILLVVRETGLRTVLQEELREQLKINIDACSPSELSSDRNLSIGAQVVTSPGVIREVAPMVSCHRPPVPLVFSPATMYLELIDKMTKPSIIAVVSLSQRFLLTARALMSPLMGRQHVLKEFLFFLNTPHNYKAFDLVFCDSIAFRSVQTPKKILYRLIAPECLKKLSKLLES
jgi:DNA-binding transcriptional regulator YhcF (GntR family)